ncbi:MULTISPECIES: MBL fold metallo-hydrolase [unclassified Streptomyces]|uniref:MBL fold metallo-hydrolase n=1 Tax=Streptomyces TaxID=1883 RepID=UPI000BFDDD67|nr:MULTISPECIES: MBL fold metallo-hydrolase [unclassified Streptomyces]MBT1104282.1 MBL fold metallo-hydrolase [Streptomyces sp. Tu10]WTC69494.1 MBL fold metallo-hydrolase [Streptomyces anulatus]
MDKDTDVQRPKRRIQAFGRRAVLRGAAVGAAAPLLAATTDATATAAQRGAPAAGSASFRWLGTSGWRIDVGGRTVLFDPYITRFRTGLFDGGLEPGTKLRSDPGLVREHVGRPEIVLVSHAHWDHIADVPHIAKSTGARVVGTETTFHLLVAFGVDPGQISVVKGGEVLDFDGITVQVVPSLHSRNKRHSYFAPGTLNAPPAAAPRTISDLPEGDTLAFQVTAGNDGPSAFLMGASDFSEQAVQGLRPDLAMVAVPAGNAVFRYTSRLLRALDRPGVVVPVHWDNFEEPLSEPPRRDPVMDLDGFVAQVHKESPTSRIVVPDYRTTYGADMRAGTSTA